MPLTRFVLAFLLISGIVAPSAAGRGVTDTGTADAGSPGSNPSVKARSGLTILDFHSPRCGPCLQMRKEIARLEEKGYPVRSVDISQEPAVAKRYQITRVPTFLIVDPQGQVLAATEGYQPASEIAALYRTHRDAQRAEDAEPQAQTQVSSAPTQDNAAEIVPVSNGNGNGVGEGKQRSTPVNPKPWQTVVRIKVHGSGTIGYGSGTIIHSTPTESVVLTCAHIFKIDGVAQQPVPSRFSRTITVDLFDGKLHGLNPAQVHKVETVRGQVIDYDHQRDIGLLVIRPGRKLPASRVAPSTWVPKSGMEMVTVGCSEGNDATAWSTSITNPAFRGLVGKSSYEAIECHHAPKQGRSGGGLYTLDGYLAGVCDFAEPMGNVGLYASIRSIHRFLDRNELTALYQPVTQRPESYLAEREREPADADAAASRQNVRVRAQSPDGEGSRDGDAREPQRIASASTEQEREPAAVTPKPIAVPVPGRNRGSANGGIVARTENASPKTRGLTDEVILPEPEILGIGNPALTRSPSESGGAVIRRPASPWRSVNDRNEILAGRNRVQDGDRESASAPPKPRAITTDLEMDPSVTQEPWDNDTQTQAQTPKAATRPPANLKGGWKVADSPWPAGRPRP